PASRGGVVRSHLVAWRRAWGRHASVNARAWLALGPVAVVNARWVPPAGFRAPDVRGPRVGLCEGLPACAWVGPGQAVGLDLHGVDGWFEEMASDLEPVEVGGEWVRRPWDLVARNADHLVRDF